MASFFKVCDSLPASLAVRAPRAVADGMFYWMGSRPLVDRRASDRVDSSCSSRAT